MGDADRLFVTGGTGYVGSRLIPVLQNSGWDVVALCREQSKGKLPGGCKAILGDALDGESYRNQVKGARTFVQLVRPWYVLGPGHLWPYALVPFYRLAEMFPATRDGARRLGLVSIREMVNTLAAVIAQPAMGISL